MDRRQEIIDYYERIRKQQKEDGTYNPNLSGSLAPGDFGYVKPTVRIKTRVIEMIRKYELDPTLI